MNEWSCISASPVCLHCVDRDFLIFHMPRPSRRNEVAMQCEAPVIQISAYYLPGPHIRPPHHSAVQPPLLALPTMLHLFFVITMAKDTKFHTWQVNLSCNLLSRIPTLVVHMHATKECSGGIAPHILKVGTRLMRFLSLTLQETPPALVKRSLARNGIRTLDRPTRSSHYTELSLLLRAYLSTETEKVQQ
jgi:hypothetical protein